MSSLNPWIERLTNLRHLFLSGGNILKFFVNRWETPLYSLIEFQLNNFLCDNIHELGKLSLSQKAPNLKVVDLSDTKNIIYSLSTIRNLTSLQRLDVSGSLALLVKDNLHREWMLKDGSLQINSLAFNKCFSYRNFFQNVVEALSKIVWKTQFFCQKAPYFVHFWLSDFVQISTTCGPNTYQIKKGEI